MNVLLILYMLSVVNILFWKVICSIYLSLVGGFDSFLVCDVYHSHHLTKNRVSSRVVKEVVEELEKILAFNSLLISLKNHPDADRFALGVGPVALLGRDPN